jgi:putative intracellular protease/amidase
MRMMPFLLQDKLIERGAKHIYGEPWKENVVVDGRLVTGQNPVSAKAFAEEIVQQLKAR